MTDKLRAEIAQYFYESTGLNAIVISSISFNQFIIEGSDGNIYYIR